MLPALAALFSATVSRADLAWLDFQASPLSPATLHQAVPAATGASVTHGPITFTLVSEGIDSRSRDYADPVLKDFAMIDGEDSAIVLRIAGLPAGSYTVESWHFDRSYPGALGIGYGRVGETPEVLVPKHVFTITPATYTIRSDGHSVYELTFRENSEDNRVRLNGLRLRASDAPPSPPGIFVDIDYINTSAVSGFPDPFFTDDATAPGFLGGQLWRRRPGFGVDLGGNRDVFEKDANEGVGDACPLVTIARDLPIGATYGVYVAFISRPTETWQVKAGLSPGNLTLFTRQRPAGRVIDLGVTGEQNSNRNQYLGFVGNATVGPEGALWLYSDDGDGTDAIMANRTWLDGFYLGAPVVTSPLPNTP